MLVSSDDQVKAYIKKIMSQLDKWMIGGKISKLVVVITSKDTGEHVERWQFDVCLPFHLILAWDNMLRSVSLNTGPNLQQTIFEKILEEVCRQRKCCSRVCPSHKYTAYCLTPKQWRISRSSPRENRSRNPIRDPIHLPPNHRFCNISPGTRWRLYI